MRTIVDYIYDVITLEYFLEQTFKLLMPFCIRHTLNKMCDFCFKPHDDVGKKV